MRLNINLTVRNKLYIGFIAVAMLTVVLGVVGYTQLGSVNAKYDYILENINIVKDSAMEMIITVQSMTEAASEYVSYAYADNAVAAEFAGTIDDFDVYETTAADLPLVSGGEILFYIKNPGYIGVDVIDSTTVIKVITNNAEYVTEKNIEIATSQ